MNCYGFKGGSGTASRIVPFAGDDWTVGVFLQANFGSRGELTVAGVPAGRLLRATTRWPSSASRRPAPVRSSWWWPPTRRCCPASARRWPGG